MDQIRPWVPPRAGVDRNPMANQGSRPPPNDTARPPDESIPAPDPIAGVDINTATAEELASVKGIGAATAERIIVHRKSEPFKSVDDLARVGGINAKLIERIRDKVTV